MAGFFYVTGFKTPFNGMVRMDGIPVKLLDVDGEAR